MAGSINKVILVGNLGADPEIRQTKDGRPIANLSIATGESWKDKNTGERREKTEWHRVVIFSEGLAKIAEQYLRKGSKVYIEGQLQTRKWQDQNGQDKYTTEVVLQSSHDRPSHPRCNSRGRRIYVCAAVPADHPAPTHTHTQPTEHTQMKTTDLFALYGANEAGQITGTVTNLERMSNSRAGNPRFVITLENDTGTHSFFTKPNAMCAYKVHSGLVGQPINARLLMYYGKVQIGSYDAAA